MKRKHNLIGHQYCILTRIKHTMSHLPYPSEASTSFLEQLGLEPERFTSWLERQDADKMKAQWSRVVNNYFNKYIGDASMMLW
jgi:hypothetical protein